LSPAGSMARSSGRVSASSMPGGRVPSNTVCFGAGIAPPLGPMAKSARHQLAMVPILKPTTCRSVNNSLLGLLRPATIRRRSWQIVPQNTFLVEGCLQLMLIAAPQRVRAFCRSRSRAAPLGAETRPVRHHAAPTGQPMQEPSI
jgi:hypothetical protein